MPSRLKRYQQNGQLHFLTFSCYRRLPYLAQPSARRLFEQCLEAARLRCQFRILGYVVMPEHVHLLVSEPQAKTLATAIQSLKQSVSRRMQGKRTAFWLARYYDFNVSSEEKKIEKLRYIHRNPVARGLVCRPEDWQWSSFRHYQTGERGTVEIESWWTIARRTGKQIPESFRAAVSQPRPTALP